MTKPEIQIGTWVKYRPVRSNLGICGRIWVTYPGRVSGAPIDDTLRARVLADNTGTYHGYFGHSEEDADDIKYHVGLSNFDHFAAMLLNEGDRLWQEALLYPDDKPPTPKPWWKRVLGL